MTIKVSIVIPCLNSHEIVRRQFLHWRRIGMPTPDVEIIVMDDGSKPPLESRVSWPWQGSVRIVPTNDFRPWTWALARNAGARLARGEYLLMTDMDYILPRGAIDAARKFTGDKLRFKREFGVLDENGVFKNDFKTLQAYGLPLKRIQNKGSRMPPHPNNFSIRKELYWQMGGFREDLLDKPYPQGEDRWFKRKWVEFCDKGLAKESESDDRPTIYMFPNGQFCGDVDADPKKLFHELSRKNDFNPAHLKLTGAANNA
jgi:hypothetical protein